MIKVARAGRYKSRTVHDGLLKQGKPYPVCPAGRIGKWKEVLYVLRVNCEACLEIRRANGGGADGVLNTELR